jgi:hypothetical protein
MTVLQEIVIPAQAGNQQATLTFVTNWVPAFAGMT